MRISDWSADVCSSDLDFDPDVQAAGNRIQPLEMVEKALNASRAAGFQSVNADLIYGLPRQTLASFDRSLDQLIRLSPDRIALYNYAHLPSRFKAQIGRASCRERVCQYV